MKIAFFGMVIVSLAAGIAVERTWQPADKVVALLPFLDQGGGAGSGTVAG